jgi:hypothetical protein
MFFEGQDDNPQFFDGKLNPLLLILTSIAAFTTSKTKRITQEKKVFFWFAILFFIIATTQTVTRVRYIAPILPILVILSILGIEELSQRLSRGKTILSSFNTLAPVFLVLIGLTFNFQYLISQFAFVKPFNYISGRESRAEYITRYRPEFPVIEYANQTLQPTNKILCIFLGNRGYYFDIPHTFDTRNNRSYITELVKYSETPDEIYRGLRKDNISHLLIWHELWDNWKEKELSQHKRKLWQSFSEKHTVALKSHEKYALYKLKP